MRKKNVFFPGQAIVSKMISRRVPLSICFVFQKTHKQIENSFFLQSSIIKKPPSEITFEASDRPFKKKF